MEFNTLIEFDEQIKLMNAFYDYYEYYLQRRICLNAPAYCAHANTMIKKTKRENAPLRN